MTTHSGELAAHNSNTQQQHKLPEIFGGRLDHNHQRLKQERSRTYNYVHVCVFVCEGVL